MYITTAHHKFIAFFLFQSLSLSRKCVENGEMEESMEQPVFMDLQEQSSRDVWIPKAKWQTRGGGEIQVS